MTLQVLHQLVFSSSEFVNLQLEEARTSFAVSGQWARLGSHSGAKLGPPESSTLGFAAVQMRTEAPECFLTRQKARGASPLHYKYSYQQLNHTDVRGSAPTETSNLYT